MSYLTKTETSLVIWLTIITIVARRVSLLSAYTKTSMPLVNCIVNDGLVNVMPNMQKTLFQFTTLVQIKLSASAIYKKIFNRNRKLQQKVSKLSALKSGVCVQKSKYVTFSSAFSYRYAKTRTYNFCKVVRQQYYMDFVRNLPGFSAVK